MAAACGLWMRARCGRSSRSGRRHPLSDLLVAGATFGTDTRPPLAPLVLRRFFNAGGNDPDVSGWIHDPAGAITPELVLDGDKDPRAGSHGTLDYRIDVVNIDKDHHGRAAISRRGPAIERGPLRFDHDHRTANRDQRMRDCPIRPRSPDPLNGVKGGLAEVEFRTGVLANQHWHHYRSAFGYHVPSLRFEAFSI